MPIDMTAASAAPKSPPRKSSGQGATTRAKTASSAPRTDVRESRLTGALGIGQLGQTICIATGQMADAATIGQHWEGIAREVVNVAETEGNEWLANGLDLLVKVGPYTALAFAVMPFALQLAANHKMLDASKLGGRGVVSPEVLEAQMQAQMAQMEVDALRQKNEALQYAAQMRQEHAQAMAEYQTLSAPESGE